MMDKTEIEVVTWVGSNAKASGIKQFCVALKVKKKKRRSIIVSWKA